jgi:hypothetical protein
MKQAASVTGWNDTGPDHPLPPVFPSLALCLGGALCWGVAMAMCAYISLLTHDRLPSFHLRQLLVIYCAGGTVAWPILLPMARFLSRRRGIEARFAAHFVLLSVGTVAITALAFALDYRLFYAQWHEPFGTVVWAFQFAFTTAGAVYQFLVMGLGLYLPVGLPVLAGASLWLARSMSPSMR